MKKFLKHYRLIPFLLALIVTVSLSYGVVHAQGTQAYSGDKVCGQWDPSIKNKDGTMGAIKNPCTIKGVADITKNVLTGVISIGLVLLVVFITSRVVIAWFALRQGNASAYKDALQKAGNALLGFMLIVALFGGLLFAMLQYFGVKGEGNDINPLQLLKLFSDAFIPHAYAQGQTLPNPIRANSLYDLILDVVRLIMRFFIYPALISIWVWTGFAFVFAQGRPEALTKAKKWLMWAFATTLVIFFLQAFLVAVQGTVQKILPGGGVQQQTAPDSYPITSSIADGDVGSVCTTSTGAFGTLGTDNKCYAGRAPESGNATTFCQYRVIGTLCVLDGRSGTGVCRKGAGTTNDCVLAKEKDMCITTAGQYGSIDQFGKCVFGTADGRTDPLAGQNGSGCVLNGKNGTWTNGTCYVGGPR